MCTDISVVIAIPMYFFLPCACKGGLGNKICARDIEGELLQLNCYESFFLTCVTWKLTAKRPAGRHKDANKKDIYRRRALSSPPGSLSLFWSRAPASTSCPAVDAD